MSNDDLIMIEDSISYVVTSTRPPKERKTIGNIPPDLHDDLAEFAEENNLKMYQVVAALWDFLGQYEEVHETALEKLRKKKR